MTGDPLRLASAAVRAQVADFPRAAVVLGSGWGGFERRLDDAVRIRLRDLPHWPAVRVAGHDGQLVVGRARGRSLAVLAGRTHFYEGGGTAAVTFGVRVLALLGVRTLILTSASGAVSSAFAPGTVVIVDDHLNLTGTNPLIGGGDETAPPFVDMTEAYSERLRRIAEAVASAQGVVVGHGVYAGVSGPSYETPAEVRALRALGADLVGMSMVHETIAARHAGMDVLGLSLVTNAAAGVAAGGLRHADVLDTGRRTATALGSLLEQIVEHL